MPLATTIDNCFSWTINSYFEVFCILIIKIIFKAHCISTTRPILETHYISITKMTLATNLLGFIPSKLILVFKPLRYQYYFQIKAIDTS